MEINRKLWLIDQERRRRDEDDYINKLKRMNLNDLNKERELILKEDELKWLK